MFSQLRRNPWFGFVLLLCLVLPTGLIWGAELGNVVRRVLSPRPLAVTPTTLADKPVFQPQVHAPAAVERETALTPAAPVQTGAGYNLVKSVLSGGGGTSTDGTNQLSGSAGQSVASTSTGGVYTLSSGFWPGEVCPTITVNVPSTNTGMVGTAFSQSFTQSGGTGTVTFTQTGMLPNGLTLATSGVLSGTPTQTGTFPISVTATDVNLCPGTANYTLTINCQTITVTVPSTNTGTAGVFFSQTFIQTAGIPPVNFTLNSGTLPTGITLAANGTLSGTTAQLGSFPITVKVADANNCMGVSATYTLNIVPNCPTITVNPASATLTAGTTGTAYSQTFTQTGSSSAITWSNPGGGLPNGLSLNSSTGVLSGVPTTAGSFSFTIRAADANQCTGERQYALTINCPTITISPVSLPPGFVNVPFSQTFTQTGGSGAISWTVSAGALPTGVNLNSTTGQLAGLSLLASTANFTIRATDTNGCTGARAYTLTFRPKAKADFDNDGKTDLSVFRPTAVDPVPNWLALGSLNGAPVNFSWGGGYAPYFDVPVPGDYDGDGKADYAIWRGADTFWYLRRSSDGQPVLVFYGANFAPYFDIPVPGDYDGDGKTDIAVFRRSGTWFIRRSSDGGDTILNHGQAGDVPLAADFDGDGKCDFGLFRPSAVTNNWLILQSSTNTVVTYQWGGGYAPYFDTPVPADYDGDGKADLAIWRGADSIWYIRPSATPNNPILDLWGANYAPYNDIPTPGDYDGDGKADIAVFRRSGTWFVKRSSNGSNLIQEQGQQGDVPLPANGVR